MFWAGMGGNKHIFPEGFIKGLLLSVTQCKVRQEEKNPENMPCSLFIARQLPIQTAAVKMII